MRKSTLRAAVVTVMILATLSRAFPVSTTSAGADAGSGAPPLEITIDPIRPRVQATDVETLRLMHLLNVPVAITVAAEGNAQAAINTAMPGDIVILEGGAAYSNILLPAKPGASAEYITIQSSRLSEMPEGSRVSPAQSALFAKIQSIVAAEPAIKTAAGAHHYKLIGIEASTATAGAVIYDIVRLGDGRDLQKTLDVVPHHLTLDRCYIHGFSTQESQRGISLNSAETTVSNSYISEIHGIGFDTQAAAGWNGPGPFHIINNHLEGAGENLMFGGADSASAELIPADIEIRRNYLFKPLSWKVGHPTYAGKHWTIKNLLELKSAKRVEIDANVMENNWTDGQSGVAVLFTVRNQECSALWSTVQKVTYTNNTLRNAEGGFNLLGKDNEAELAYGKCKNAATAGSVRGSDLLISNNLTYEINGAFLTMNGFDNVTIDRNTHVQKGNLMTIYGQPSQGFRYTNNLTIDHDYGIYVEGAAGVAGLNNLTPGWVIENNTIAAPYDKSIYPPNNDYPASIVLPADFRSPIANRGADVDALKAAQSGSVVSSPTPTPTPTPTPQPTPTATPSPSPEPSPSPISTPTPTPMPTPAPVCSISAPTSITLLRRTSTAVSVSLANLTGEAVTVTVLPSSGQVTVSPLSKTISGTSAVIAFSVGAKQNPGAVTFSSRCGSATTRVLVR